MRGAGWVAVAACGLLVPALHAQSPPAETCGPAAFLGPFDTLTWNGSYDPSSLDFTMSEPSCEASIGDDLVVCFTPSSSCSVDVTCWGGVYTTFSAFEGPCVTEVSWCLYSGNMGVLDWALIGGQTYCVVCSTAGAGAINVSVGNPPGEDCGPFIPPGLLFFDGFESGTVDEWSSSAGG